MSAPAASPPEKGPSNISRPLNAVCAVPHSWDLNPSQRYRWEQWQAGLRNEGIELQFLNFCSPEIDQALRAGHRSNALFKVSARYPIWLKELSQARDADLLIIPRKAAPAGPLFIESWATRGKARFVYDFDDAIFHDERAFYKRLLDPPSRCKNLCERAALVITGNDYLAQWAEPHSRRVEVIPTTVDTQTHRPRAQKTHSRLPVIGWCGSRTTAQYLVELLPTLREVQQEHPFEILVVGAEIELGDIRGRCVPWSSASEVALLQKMDIGLMPLRAGAWEQGKCALKALLYGAVGIPSVVSKVGANVQAVVHGQTGFHAASLAEWKVFLLRLLENEQEREALGQQARIHIEANYSAQRWVPELGQALRSCL